MQLSEIVSRALEEDVGNGDITTLATVPAETRGSARIIAKQDLVVCGHDPAAEVFRQVGASYTAVVGEGTHVTPGTVIATVSGPARALLTGERLALNFMMRLCGIATRTADTVKLAGDRMRVVDTRKTTPLMRALERRAVRIGGGHNHRFALYDGILIKDNHILAAGSVTAAVEGARAHAHHLMKIELEVEDLSQLEEALDIGVDVVLLDNMDNETLARAVEINQGRAILEASGNMTADRLPALARIGIDIVSIGGLIHQATWSDLSMRFD
ncbi:MAG: nicotinate-nucleotide pyrophosphorylase (carboxylating) [Myxococcota bacterium]|jgi:nicotinate-nucleotide pyrophosphorylase (carboxylating)